MRINPDIQALLIGGIVAFIAMVIVAVANAYYEPFLP